MADDNTTRTTQKSSKWSKLISKDKSDKAHFRLNEDVVDFLKPSTEKYSGDAAGTRQWSSAPRIDVAITQRWPGANELKGLMEVEPRLLSASGRSSNNAAMPRRRNKKNLTVSFARTSPEIIGEGGDECDVVVTEVSRMKVARLRSFSDNRPPPPYPVQDDSFLHYGQAGHRSHLHGPPADPYARPDIQRAKTIAGDTHHHTHRKPVQLHPQPRQYQPLLPSPEKTEKRASPPSKEPRPGLLTRHPTGFSSYSGQDDSLPPTPDTDVPAMSNLSLRQASPSHGPEPLLGSDRETAQQPSQELNSPPSSPSLPPSAKLFVQKAQNKTDAEGRNFRRVSQQSGNEEDLVHLRNVSLSSVEPDGPPRMVSASKQESLKLAQDYQFAIEGHHTSGGEPGWNNATNADNAEFETPRASRVVVPNPPVPPHLTENERLTPSLRIQTPVIDNVQVPVVAEEERLISPDFDTSRHSLSRPEALSDTLSPGTVNTIASYMNFTSDESARSGESLQPMNPGFTPLPQGITPARSSDPHQETHASYFALRPSQANQPAAHSSRHASANSYPQAPSPYASQAASPYISQAASPYRSHASSPSISSGPQQSDHRPASQASSYKAFSPNGGRVDSPEQVAYNDFDARVAHMRGVFRLTAERECPIASASPRQWLRAAIWWLHKGRAGLGQIVRKLPRDPDGQIRELLTQAHVDVAKTWWILTEQFEDASCTTEESPTRQNSLGREVEVIRSHLRSLALSMKKNGVMPPHQSLIQGQDTTIWIRYPRFASDAASLLRGPQSLVVSEDLPETDPLEALPAGDSRSAYFYNRMFVNVSVNTDDANTDRAVLPCVLTMMRVKTDFQPTIIFSSQSDLVNVSVRPHGAAQGKGPTWQNVSWKARSHGLYVQLPRGFNLNVELGESDFRGLWNMVEFTRKIEASLQPQADERLVHRANLAELQYSDSSNPHVFPREKVRACTAVIFEKGITQRHGTGARRMHRGFRLLLLTNPVYKTLSSVTHELCRDEPLLFEKLGNPAANDMPALVIHVQESKRVCKALMIFERAKDREHLYDVLNGIALGQNEALIRQAPLMSCTIEYAAALMRGSVQPEGGALAALRWEGVRVVNKPGAGGQDVGNTVLSEDLRMISTHESGCLTDRLNLGPGELLLRLPIQQSTTLQFLRGPQEDMSLSIDTRRCQPHTPGDLADLLHNVRSKPTIRSMTFGSVPELHAFQSAITKQQIRYDSTASLFAISRRRMVVPIYKKLETNKVRLQILAQGNVIQIAAFFEDFAYADAMVFQVKPSDVFEKAKHEKGGKYCVKLVDAKFSLPKKEKEQDGMEDDGGMDGIWTKGVQRRFVNFEGLEYAEEHDDITIGFDSEEDRDRFCERLPAATTTKRFELRRKI